MEIRDASPLNPGSLSVDFSSMRIGKFLLAMIAASGCNSDDTATGSDTDGDEDGDTTTGAAQPCGPTRWGPVDGPVCAERRPGRYRRGVRTSEQRRIRCT